MKNIIKWKNNSYYYLGTDCSGINYFLNKASFDCSWYWGLGYISTFTNNENPSLSRDIASHEHFDYKFLKDITMNGYDKFNSFFTIKNKNLTDKNTWLLIELMETLYTLREYSDTIYRGGSHYTNNPLREIIKNPIEYDRINKELIPKLLNEIYNLLGSGV